MNWNLIGGGVLALVAAAALALLVLNAPDGAPEDTVVIEMQTSRYEWTPGSDVPVEVPQGSLVVLRVTSTDVTHGLAIDGYGINEEVPAGETVEVRFRADREGEFLIYCTVFCGVGHPEHRGTLNVVA